MNKLSKICVPSKHLLPSQLLFFKEHCEQQGGKFVFIHKFLVLLEFKRKKLYIKINVMDQEFYVFSKQYAVQFFYSFSEMNTWFDEHVFKKGKVS